MTEVDDEQFASELDAAIQAHLEWTRRILRCVVLRSSPSDDMLKDDAHIRCSFGCWLVQERILFEELNHERTQSLIVVHKAIHDAIRAICTCALEGRPGKASDLDTFEAMQKQLIDHLSYFKTLAITRSVQIDALTGLPLRYRMEQDFSLLTRPLRTRNRLHVMLIDVDHFKAINDQYGHGGGDEVLKKLSMTFKNALREGDLVYRYGGDEFLVLMQSSVGEVAALRLLNAVRIISVNLKYGKTVRPTVSIGGVSYVDGEDLTTLISNADAALYKAKAMGGNCYAVASDA